VDREIKYVTLEFLFLKYEGGAKKKNLIAFFRGLLGVRLLELELG
jgi:hypothetical protein